jgi:MoaA/NifB/PqqE/SkfB family radical SAM enzyme
MSAFAGADTRGELTTAECRRVIDEIATVNPNVFLILTGGEPFLRRDLFEIPAHAAEQRFTSVLGTNGILLREKEAALMRQHGVLGASISLDSTDRDKHDAFRHLPGAWDGAVRATRVLADAGLDFSLHMSVTDWNVGEVPAMIDLARKLGAKVLNFFFLVRTGRGRDLTDIDAQVYERILTYLARAQGVGGGPPSFVQRLLGRSPLPGPAASFEDPWSTPVGHADGLLIRAKWRISADPLGADPSSLLLKTTRTAPVAGKCLSDNSCGDSRRARPCPWPRRLAPRVVRDLWRGGCLPRPPRALLGRCRGYEFSNLRRVPMPSLSTPATIWPRIPPARTSLAATAVG